MFIVVSLQVGLSKKMNTKEKNLFQFSPKVDCEDGSLSVSDNFKFQRRNY